MRSNKKVGGAEAISETTVVLLEPNDSNGGGNYFVWLENLKQLASEQDAKVSNHLSFITTGERFRPPYVSRAQIIAQNTIPAVPAGEDDDPPAVAAVVPSNATVAAMELDAHVRRNKTIEEVNACGTIAWTVMMKTIGIASKSILQADARYDEADSTAIKDAFVLMQIINTTHGEGGAGGVPQTSQGQRRIEDAFYEFKQKDMEIGQFHKEFSTWMKRLAAAGVTPMTEKQQVTCFFSKLDSRRYGELLTYRENKEHECILFGTPVPEITMAQALTQVRGFVSTHNPGKQLDRKSLGVFTLSEGKSVDEADVKAAIKVIASAVPGASTKSVMLALRNSHNGKGKPQPKDNKEADGGPPMMINGRPWTKKCAVPGCNQKHPFHLHTMITGLPCDAESQKKIDAYKAKQLVANIKKQDAILVAAAAVTSDDDDDFEANQYFIGVATGDNELAGDDDEEGLYSTLQFSVLMNKTKLTPTAEIELGKTPFDDNQLLLDNQAGVSIIKNLSMLNNLRRKRRIINGIGGKDVIAEFEGQLPAFPGVWFVGAPTAVANILAECDAMAAGFKISLEDGVYTVTTPTTTLVFETLPGWHAHPTCQMPVADSDSAAFVSTIAQNLANYSKSEQQYAARARQLQKNLGLPGDQTLIRGLSGINNTGVTPADVQRATAIAGAPLAKVRGGSTLRATPAQRIEAEVPRKTSVSLIMEIDIFVWRGLYFLIAVLLPICYIMATYLKHRTVAEIGAAITAFIAAAAARMFRITLVQCDGEKAVAAYTEELNRAGVKVESQPGVHCPHVERVNRTLGEFVRGQENGGLAFRLGKALLVMCVLFKVSRLNLLPTKASPDNYGAFVRYEGIAVDAKRDLRFAFGDYAETLKTSTVAKSASRTEACVMGIPTMNRAGSVICYKLSTRQMVTRQHFTIRPMPDIIIQELNDIADSDNLPASDQWIGDHSWEFQFEDDIAPAAAAPAVLPQLQAVMEAGVIAAPVAAPPVAAPAVPRIGHNVVVEAGEVRGAPANAEAPNAGEAVNDLGAAQQPVAPVAPVEHQQQPLPPQLPVPARRGVRGGSADSLRSAPGSVILNIKDLEDRSAIRKELMQRRHWHDKEFCFKISVRAALRDRGESAKSAILDELQSIVDKSVFHGVHMRNLTSEQRKAILRSVTFLKDKYTAQNIFDKFKARLCVDGSRQDHNMYEDVSSPTATSASVLSCAAIAAAEHRHVMTVDVKGAFLHADIKATGVIVHVQLDKVMTQFLLELDPSYAEFVRDDGTCVVQLDKALYGTIEAAKLWYDNVSARLRADGFVQNPYDQCVFNKVNANGVQITVVLYVDDMMVSCEDSLELDTFSAMLRAHYGGDQITEHRGEVLDFLGMTFDFTTAGKVRVTMKHLVDEIIAGCGVVQERKTPATEDLFETRDTVAKLGPEQRDYFRSYTAKLLYVGKRVKPEMLTAISFLTTRANSPDTDDLAKLLRALGYLLYTRDRGIVLCIGDTMTVGGFIDAAYGVHTSSGKSHSGCAMVLGNAGPVHVKSTKQKLVTKSSTEAELVALSDYASQAIWLRNFILAQGYDVGPVILHQDNMSCMALIKRGGPASERSRHIDIRHFWVKEKVDDKDAVVRHLPTDKMFVNVMTKPLQGQQFIRERNALTNWY